MNTCRKTLVCLAVLVMSVMLSFTCMASENIGEPIELSYNNTEIQGAMLVNDTAYAPYRALVAAIEENIEFSWNAEKAASIAKGEGIEIIAYSAKNYIEANGRVIYNDIAANLNIDSTLYVPVRSIVKAYSLNCTWNPAAMRSSVSGTPTPIKSGDEFYDSDVLYWLSRIISAESRGEPFRGQIAVGNVVLERTRDGSFPDTVYDVIFDRKHGTQFTPAATGSVYREPVESAVVAAKIALEGTEVVEALFFCATRVSQGSWMDRTREHVATIGNHVFYY